MASEMLHTRYSLDRGFGHSSRVLRIRRGGVRVGIGGRGLIRFREGSGSGWMVWRDRRGPG